MSTQEDLLQEKNMGLLTHEERDSLWNSMPVGSTWGSYLEALCKAQQGLDLKTVGEWLEKELDNSKREHIIAYAYACAECLKRGKMPEMIHPEEVKP